MNMQTDALLALNGETIIDRLGVAETSLQRMRGLLGKQSLAKNEGLWITPCNSIHMLFMKFPIDAVFIDRELCIVKVCHELKPWQFARGGKHAHSVLELPAGTARFFNLRVGDRVTITR